jgi:hypothetical protein
VVEKPSPPTPPPRDALFIRLGSLQAGAYGRLAVVLLALVALVYLLK